MSVDSTKIITRLMSFLFFLCLLLLASWTLFQVNLTSRDHNFVKNTSGQSITINALSHDYKSGSYNFLFESLIGGRGEYTRNNPGTTLTGSELSEYNLLLFQIPTGGISNEFTQGESDSITDWIQTGGILILSGSDVWTGGNTRLENINTLLEGSGIQIDFSTIYDPTNFTAVASPDEATPIFSQGNGQYGWEEGFTLPSTYTNSLTLSGNAVPLVWGDEDSYAVSAPFSTNVLHEVGSKPITGAIGAVNVGMVVVLTNLVASDGSVVDNNLQFRESLLEILFGYKTVDTSINTNNFPITKSIDPSNLESEATVLYWSYPLLIVLPIIFIGFLRRKGS